MEVEQLAERIAEQGYVILENVIEPELVSALHDAVLRLETDRGAEAGKNIFEGLSTVRLYNLLALDEVFQRVPTHPAVLPLVEAVLDRGCLVSSLSSIAIGPDEDPQPIHADDQLIPIPKPHVATVCNTMWALTDFTEENGATRLVPGSHRADTSPTPFEPQPSIAAEMRRGSVLVYHGSLWHGGGANTTASRRIGMAMNYCAGWIRQQENQQLGISPALVSTFSPRLKKLVGYGVYRGVIGHIDRRSPIGLVDPDADDLLSWAK